MDTSSQHDSHEAAHRAKVRRKLGRIVKELDYAKQDLQHLEAKRPSLRLAADKLHELGLQSLLVGKGSFAACFAVRSAEASSADTTLDDRILGTSIDALPTDTADTVPEQDQHQPGSRQERRFDLVLKALQLPIGKREQAALVYSGPKLADSADPQTMELTKLCTLYDELRWQRLFAGECLALVLCEGHPSIVGCHGWCLDDDHIVPTLVMEYAGGANLWATMFGSKRQRPFTGPLPVTLSWASCVAIYLQLLDTVDYMHFRLPGRDWCCVHRDISPGNVVVSWPNGYEACPQVKLVDFGLSSICRWDTPSDACYHQSGVAVGPDVMFIDPLMWTCKKYGRGTDVFNLGQLLLLLLFGSRSVHTAKGGAPQGSLSLEEMFKAACNRRAEMRHILRMPFEQARAYMEPVWHSCPSELLSCLLDHALECTPTTDNAFQRRPNTRVLIEDLVLHRQLRPRLPEELQPLLPTPEDVYLGSWAPVQLPQLQQPESAAISRHKQKMRGVNSAARTSTHVRVDQGT